MARGKPPLWVAWVRLIDAETGRCGQWTYRTYHGKSVKAAREKAYEDYPGGIGVSIAVQQYAWGNPNGDTTIGQHGMAIDDDPWPDDQPQP